MARSCTASPTMATSRAAARRRPGRSPAPCADRAWSRSRNRSPTVKSNRCEHVVLRQRGLQPARRVVGGEPDAEAAPLELARWCRAAPRDQRRVLGAAASGKCARCRPPADRPARPADARRRPRRCRRSLPAASTEPGVMRSVAGSWPPSAQQLVGNRGSPRAAKSADLAVDRHPGAPVVDDGAVLVEQDAADRHGLTSPSARRQAAQTAPLLRARVDRQIADRRRLARERVGRVPGDLDLVEARCRAHRRAAAARPASRRCRRSPSAPRSPAACRCTPTAAPSTPTSAQLATVPGGGASGKMQR